MVSGTNFMPMDVRGEEPPKANRGPVVGPENRAALLAAARDLFAGRGLEVPLSSVARRAGVGQGSLYRHFPTRAALVAAVFDENLDELAALTAPPDRTIDDLLDVVVAQAVGSGPLVRFLVAARHDPAVERLAERFRALVERLLARDQEAGRVAARLDTFDVLLAIEMLATALAHSDPSDRAEVAARVRALLRPGFAPPAPRPGAE